MLRTSVITLLVTAVTAVSSPAQNLDLATLSPASAAMLDDQASARAAFEQGNSSPRRDSRWNGFLIGFAIGAIPGVLLGMAISDYCENESTSCPIAIPFFGGLSGLAGGAIGFGIDSAIHGQSLTSNRPRQGPGVRFKVTF